MKASARKLKSSKPHYAYRKGLYWIFILRHKQDIEAAIFFGSNEHYYV